MYRKLLVNVSKSIATFSKQCVTIHLWKSIGTNMAVPIFDVRKCIEFYRPPYCNLSKFNEGKGKEVKATDVRKYVSEYVKKKKLNSLENRNTVIPNKELSDILKSDLDITWEELMQKIFSLMSSSYTISNATNQIFGKGKVEPIIISVASRSGNKKVTLVDNLELYGIRVSDFGKECQHGIAASTSVMKPAGKKYDQLLIQGNQVAFVGNLLTGKYKIPKRYIRGLELAIKKKK